MRVRTWVRWTVLALLGLALAPGTARAQASRLEEVESLASLGRTEEARALLTTWWAEDRAAAPRLDVQRGLWLRGRLTVDPEQAGLDFRRLVIEYPGGPFSDRALLRLAQAAHALGDGDRAETLVAQLGRDYPGSSTRREAEEWLDAAGPAPAPPTAVGPDPASGPAASASGAPSGAQDPGRGSPPPAAAAPTGSYAVQLGAFSTEERARTVVEQARRAGFEARLVRMPASQLVHVRVGRFDSAEAASDLLSGLRGAGFTSAMVRDAHLEESMRQ